MARLTIYDRIKQHLAVAQSVATVAAVSVGGIWALVMYYEGRENYARVDMEHEIRHLSLSDHANLLVIRTTMRNGSKRLFDIGFCEWKIDRILPLDSFSNMQVQKMVDGLSDEDPNNQIDHGLEWSNLLTESESISDQSLIIEPGQSAVINKFYALPSFYSVVNVTTFCADRRREVEGDYVGSYLATTYTIGEGIDESQARDSVSHAYRRGKSSS